MAHRTLWLCRAGIGVVGLGIACGLAHAAAGMAPHPSSAPAAASAAAPFTRQGTLVARGQYPPDPSLCLWLSGTHAWPNLRHALAAEPPEKTTAFRTVEIANAWLTARFVPEMGFRLYDLTWNDDPLKRQPFRRVDEIEYHYLYRWEGPGYFYFFGSMKWGFPFFGHTTSDHAPWTVTHGIDSDGNPWAEGTYTCLDTGLIGTVRAVLPKDAARVDFTFSVHNPRTCRQAFDYSIDSHVPANRHVELAMAASEAISHQRGWNLARQMFLPWPRHMDRDLRFLAQWGTSQGVFPADLRAGYSGFYDHSREMGVVRVFPHDRIFGVKYWMPGLDWGPDPVGEMFGGVDITQDERRYLEPQQTFSWQESWYPVRDLKGIDGGNGDVALRVAVAKDVAHLHLTATRQIDAATVSVRQVPPASTTTAPASQAAPRQIHQATVRLEPGRSLTIDLPPIDTHLWGSLEVTVDTGRSRFVWEEPLRLLKPVYAHDQLAGDREAYLGKLREKETAAPEVDEEHPRPADGFVFRHAGILGRKPAEWLQMPNACTRLADGSVVVADRGELKLFRPDLTFDRRLPVEGLCWPLGLCAAGQSLYVADTSNCRIACIDTVSWRVTRTIDLPSQPAGIALWRGDLAVALPRRGELLVVRLAPDSHAASQPEVIVGPNVLRHPFGLAADGDRLLVADPGNARVLAVAPDRTVTAVAEQCHGLAMPSRVAVQADGVYVLDSGRSQLLRLDPAGGPAAVHLNGRIFGPMPLSLPADLVCDGEGLVVANCHPAMLSRLAADGTVTARYERHDDRLPQSLTCYQALCRRPNGDWLAADGSFHLYWFDAQGRLIRRYGAWGRGDGQLWDPNALACDARGYVYISDLFNFRILRFDPQGEQMSNLAMDAIATDGVPAPERWYTRGLALDSAGRLAVAVCGGQGVWIYSPAPENRLLLVLRPYERFRPMGVSFDAAGNLFIVDDQAAQVIVYDGRQLASRLAAAEGQVLTSAELAPSIWPFQPHSGAMSIVADERGGCFVASTAREQPSSDGQAAGRLLHFDSRGAQDRSIVSTAIAQPRQMFLADDRLLVTNTNPMPDLGITETDVAAVLAGSPAADTQPAWRTRIAGLEIPEVPGVFRDIAGLQRIGGADGFYRLLDGPRRRWVRLRATDLSVIDTQPCTLKAHWSNVMPDGSVVLHLWGNRTAQLCEAADGHVRPLEFKDVANPVCTVRDAEGYWWVFNADKRQVLLFPPGATVESEPLWTIPCGKGEHDLGEPFGFAPLPGIGAWTSDRARGRLVLLAREDGRVLQSTPVGVVNEPCGMWRLDDGRLLVVDMEWGILVVSPDGRQSRLAVQDMPRMEVWEVYYDGDTRRLLYAIWQGEGATVGWAEHLTPAAHSPATAPVAEGP